MDRVEKQERAVVAEQLLNHPILREAFDDIRKRSITDIENAPPGDLTAAAACAMIKAVREVETYIQGIINDDKVADKLDVRRQFRPY